MARLIRIFLFRETSWIDQVVKLNFICLIESTLIILSFLDFLTAVVIGFPLCSSGLLDNVLSDYLWAKAVLLTTPTATTAGLSVQIPLAAIVDTLRGHPPHLLNYLGAASIMVGFVGINIPSEWWGLRVPHQEQDAGSIAMVDRNNDLPISSDAAAFS